MFSFGVGLLFFGLLQMTRAAEGKCLNSLDDDEELKLNIYLQYLNVSFIMVEGGVICSHRSFVLPYLLVQLVRHMSTMILMWYSVSPKLATYNKS